MFASFKSLTLLALLPAVLGATVPATTAAPAPQPTHYLHRNVALKLMPFGASIVGMGTVSCWRATLWKKLTDIGHNVDFVGTLPDSGGCPFTFDGDNEGHSGFLATNVAKQNQLVSWLNATHPDVVIMHIGSNDLRANVAVGIVLDAYTTLVQQMRNNNPNMKIFLSKILPMATGDCLECGTRVQLLNDQLNGWAQGKSTPQSPLEIVEIPATWDPTKDTVDGLHPNPQGGDKFANKWFEVLVGKL